MGGLETQAEAFISDLVVQMNQLPPEVNRYTWLAEQILLSISIPAFPPWLQRLVYAWACIFGVLFVLGVLAMVFHCLNGPFWLFRINRDGVFQPNVRVWHSVFIAAFCATTCALFVRQILIIRGELSYHNYMILEGMRWLPLFLCAWTFVHGVLAQMLGVYLELGSTLNTRSPMFATKTKLPSVSRGRLAVRALNAVAIIVPILVIASSVPVFVLANVYENRTIDQGAELITACLAAAPTYNPATFSVIKMAPYQRAGIQLFVTGKTAIRYAQMGFAVWSAWAIAIAVIFTPFLVLHCRLLRNLIGAPTIFRAIFGAKKAVKEGSTGPNVPVVPVQLPLSPNNLASPTLVADEKVIESQHLKAETPSSNRPGALPTITVARSQTLVQDYRTLLLSALFIYVSILLYLPLALMASVVDYIGWRPWWSVEILWTGLNYLTTCAVVHGFLLGRPVWKAWTARRDRRAQATSDQAGVTSEKSWRTRRPRAAEMEDFDLKSKSEPPVHRPLVHQSRIEPDPWRKCDVDF